jgi:hypothetical protein
MDLTLSSQENRQAFSEITLENFLEKAWNFMLRVVWEPCISIPMKNQNISIWA